MTTENDFEKLGVFYLGEQIDAQSRQPIGEPLLYDANDLLTHGVCLGMTGSGKTGLCIDILEEAAIDSIPVLAIDLKGDLTNLLVANPASSKRAPLLAAGNKVICYTPGSNAGCPISALSALAAPPPAVRDDNDAFRKLINDAVTSILVLLQIEPDPLQSREFILLANILKATWEKGESIDIASLVHLIQKPPVTRIGAIDLESIFSAADRFKFAMRLNNLIASPGFEAWTAGVPLDIDKFLYDGQGRPCTSIFYIAHLNETERMFFVTLLLNRLVDWMRTQSGTSSLRALLFMDEIFGYFPPAAAPPSKQPLLTLLKQARAYGLGVLLCSQNPVDLDYKGLSNAGTWFIGRLSTERDKARLLDGLEGVATQSGSFNRASLDRVISGLDKRVFLVNNVNERAPQLFRTRDTLSALTGPLTLEQVRQLKTTAAAKETGAIAEVAKDSPASSLLQLPPLLPPDIKASYLPVRCQQPAGARLVYRPAVIAVGNVRFVEDKMALDVTRQYCRLVSLTGAMDHLDWTGSQPAKVWLEDLVNEAAANASFEPPPPVMLKKKSYDGWKKDFVSWLAGSRTLSLFKNEVTGEVSRTNESERDFRIRSVQTLRELRDQAVAQLSARWESKLATLQQRLERAGVTLAQERSQATQHQFNSAISIGATMFGSIVGRRRSGGSISRAASAARSMNRAAKEQQDVKLAEEKFASVQAQLKELETRFADELRELEGKFDPSGCCVGEIKIAPKKSQVECPFIALAWAPYFECADGNMLPSWIVR